MATKQSDVSNGDLPMELGGADVQPSKGNKRLSVERIYQKKTQLEHILLRPDTYIGAVEAVTQSMWVYEDEAGIVNKEITFVPGLYKIFDEILVNAADNKQRDPKMDCIKIDIDPENNSISVWNNGKGIPVIMHKEENVFVPTLIFGILLTSSNYNDDQKKVTGGRNGFGAKLCNVFSSEFILETACNEYGKKFKQTWTTNMTKTKEPKILPHKGDDYTKVTFKPDLSKFKMDVLDKDIVGLMSRRAFDVAGCLRGVKVMLNGKRLPVKNFKDYCEQYVKDKTDAQGGPLKIVYDSVNPRWEVAFTTSEKGFQQVSFVNSIATTKGGRHVDHVSEQLINKISEVVKKKNKAKIAIKPFQIKNHMWVFVNCLIENPMFDSQTKENMTLQVKSFGSKCAMNDKFTNQVIKSGVVECIMSWVDYKAQTQLDKKCHSAKHSKLKGLTKLEDANQAGRAHSIDCTLIVTEGDSAKSTAVSGLGVVGRDKYGVFPIRGKMLNVREATHKQILENAEINDLIKALGLQYKKKYLSMDDLKSLRYGKLMIMADQDQDGSHIKGLLINFIHHNWPTLLRLPFLEEFITPIVKVQKSGTSLSFYSLPEFEEWKTATNNWQTWRVKYYKGLGTSTSEEAKEYFSDMARHRIKFKYQSEDDDAAIKLAFSKKMIDQRKEWLTNSMDERKRRRELGLPEIYLYGKNTKAVTYNDFVNKELILFSNADNERSIPSLVDGFKPGQRKVLFTCLKRNDKREVKVAQLAGSIAEHSAYHHGEQSLMSTVINLAQNYVGSNNINVLQPLGQFGTRLRGGKDAASPRYIFTMLSPLAKLIFNENDSPLLKYLFDDNQKIEPEYYVPIIPMVLVNGAEGIGTGWSTKIPNYNPREIIENIKRLLNGDDPLPMKPWYKNFKGTIDALENNNYVCSGEVAILNNNTIEITELPIKTWTQTYKENVMELMLHGNAKQPSVITDYKEYHTDATVKFIVTLSQDKLSKFEEEGMHKAFKLQSSLATTSMVLFDSSGCLRKYESVNEILREFFDVRLEFYIKRKAYMEGMLGAEATKLENQARFILEKISGKVVVENKKRKEIIRILDERGYDSDPVMVWKKAVSKQQQQEEEEVESDAESEESGSTDYNYLLTMTMWSLTEERKNELLKKRDNKQEELNTLKRKTPSDLWNEDLDEFLTQLNAVEEKERETTVATKPTKAMLKGNSKKKLLHNDVLPSPQGHRVQPKIDAEMKKKAVRAADNKEGKAKKKKEKEDKTQKKLDDVFKAMEKQNGEQSLAERLGNTPDKIEKKKKSPVKKVKLTVDTSDESDDMFEPSFEDMQPKIDRPKRTTAPKKMKLDSSDDEWGSKDEASDNDVDVPVQENGASGDVSEVEETPVNAVENNNENGNLSDGSDFMVSSNNDSDDSFKIEEKPAPKKKASKPAASAKPATKPKKTLGPKTKAAKKEMGLFDSLFPGNTQENAAGSSQSGSKSGSDSDLVIEEVVPVEKKAAPKKRAKYVASDDSDSDAPKPKKAAGATKKKNFSDSEEDDLFVVKATKKPPPKKSKKNFSDSEDGDLFVEKPVKKPQPKKTTKKKKSASDDDEDDFFAPKPTKKATKKGGGKKKKKVSSDEDDDDFNFDDSDGEEFVPRARGGGGGGGGGRARAAVKYNFGDDGSDNDSF